MHEGKRRESQESSFLTFAMSLLSTATYNSCQPKKIDSRSEELDEERWNWERMPRERRNSEAVERYAEYTWSLLKQKDNIKGKGKIVIEEDTCIYDNIQVPQELKKILTRCH